MYPSFHPNQVVYPFLVTPLVVLNYMYAWYVLDFLPYSPNYPMSLSPTNSSSSQLSGSPQAHVAVTKPSAFSEPRWYPDLRATYHLTHQHPPPVATTPYTG